MLLAVAAALVAYLLVAVPCLASSQSADHLQAIAEDAFIKGDYARAFRFFELAYATDPERTDNLHRQALCAGHLGQWGKAEALLRDVLSKSEARPEAHFDFGLALYMQGQYRDALNALDRAAELGVDLPTLDYYRGAAYFRLGEFEQALAPLSSASRALPQRNAHLGYYLGGTDLALGDYEAAIENLQRAYERTEPGAFRDLIGRLLMEAEEKRRRQRWFEIRFDLGGAYDSNVFYEPEEFEIADREGFLGYTDLDIALYPYRRDWASIGVGYRFYQSLHVDTTKEQLLSDFNLTSHMPRLEAMLRIVPGRVPVYLGGAYERSRHFLAGEHYQDANVYTPYFTISETHWTATQLGARLETNRFKKFNERDAFYAAPAIAQLFAYAKGTGRLFVEASYEHNDADAEQYTYRGIGGYVATDFTLVGPLDVLAGWRYRYLDYTQSEEGRIDRKMVIDAALRVHATRWLAFGTGYRFQNNVSLDPFSYEKHVYYLETNIAF